MRRSAPRALRGCRGGIAHFLLAELPIRRVREVSAPKRSRCHRCGERRLYRSDGRRILRRTSAMRAASAARTTQMESAGRAARGGISPMGLERRAERPSAGADFALAGFVVSRSTIPRSPGLPAAGGLGPRRAGSARGRGGRLELGESRGRFDGRSGSRVLQAVEILPLDSSRFSGRASSVGRCSPNLTSDSGV